MYRRVFLFYSTNPHRFIFTTQTLDTMLCSTPKIRGDLSNIIPSLVKLCRNMMAVQFSALHISIAVLIGSRQRLSTLERNPIIEINKSPIKHVSTSKSLGVHIDGNLSWECHINEISKKIASGISAIKRIRYFLPFEIHWYSHTLITVM